MAPSDSFDPRTWNGEDTVAPPGPAALDPPAVRAGSGANSGWWLGPLLSAAVLAGGAFAAYQTRDDPAAQTLVSPAR
jgi:hypothetical protein